MTPASNDDVLTPQARDAGDRPAGWTDELWAGELEAEIVLEYEQAAYGP
jgi:hypothetical protein